MGLFVDALSRRLRVHDYLQTHASVLDDPVEKPLINIGMPRTGTTVISWPVWPTPLGSRSAQFITGRYLDRLDR
ncbi:hypothetical protein [Mycolicibacterium vinylchloridicum]|uniref:hypothetical protein n=1 Tax=Mycolicibacterium vinylchloridicum TaxID=2736928 RepID=UPI0015C7464D